MRTLAAHVTAITLFAASSAGAADLRMPVKAPPPVAPAPAYNWTGCYVGGGGGYGMFNQESRFIEGTFVSQKNDNGGRGWFGTVQVGCDIQVGGNFVIGAFGDYDWSGIKGDMSVPVEGLVGEEKLKSSWAAGGRIGWIPWSSSQFLVYVSGGWTEARFNQVNFVSSFSGVPANVALAKHTYSGWFVGAGYEYGLSWFPIQGIFWKTEYRFADYSADRLPVAFGGLTVPVPPPSFIDSRKFVQTVRSELVWRFNWGGPVVARY